MPEISIPVHTVQEGALSLPVSLNYHSGGVRVDEVASWVGLGWSLSAGGMITRTVHGGPDEGATDNMPGALSPYVGWGWYKNGGILPEIIQCSPRPISTEGPVAGSLPSYGGCASLYYEAAKGYIDCEPDLFTFSFAGYSGKFFFDESRKIHMIPESDVYIEPVNSPGYFYAWKIIAPDGTKYFFGGANATEITYSDFDGTNGNRKVSASTTWNLYRIESANGERWIELDYVEDTYSFGNRGGHSVTFRMAGPCPDDHTAISIFGDVDDASTVISASVVDGKRLSRIRTSSGYTTIDFITSSSPREDLTKYDKSIPVYSVESANLISKPLQFIQIAAGPVCKKFELSHDYFPSADCPGYTSAYTFDKKRLKLNWIREITCGGVAQPKYEFSYDPTPLPRRYSLARDMWGYYNGFDGNKGLLEDFSHPNPVYTVTYTTGNYRTTVEDKMKGGVLKKIVYPTGGSSEFEYEAHRENAASPAVGGLRVKRITTVDDYGNTSVKNITYEIGKLYLDPSMFLWEYPNSFDDTGTSFIGGADFGATISSNPVATMWSSQGYHIGYSKVRVDETNNGYTTYSYLNTSPLAISQMFPFVPLVAGIGTADLSSQTTFRQGASELDPTSAHSVVRQNTGGTKTVTARTVKMVGALNFCGGRGEFGLFRDYAITTYRFNATSKNELKQGVTTTTTYTYGPMHNNPVSEEFADSNGAIRRSEWKYASDAGSGAPAAMYDKSNPDFKNMLGTVVEQKGYAGSTLISKATMQYIQQGSRILLASTKTYPSGGPDFIEEQYQYNSSSDLASILGSNGLNKAFVWGYRNALPVASVENAVYAESAVTVPHSFGTSVSANTISCVSLGTLTVAEDQTVNFSPAIVLSQAGTWIKLTLKNSTGGIVYGPRHYAAGETYPESVYLQAGTYTFCYESGNFPSPYTGYSSINFTVNPTDGKQATILYTGFEDTGITAAAHTGDKVWSGTYSLRLPHIAGEYILSYWKRPASGGAWILTEDAITVSSPSSTPYQIGQSGYYIDDVRLYPKGGLMTTYTYAPGIGITSATDPNHVTTFYEYDAFGRLATVKDDKLNVVKTYQYHMKGQN